MRVLFLAIALLGGPAQAQVPNVVTDIAPVHALVSAVMAGLDKPQLLLDGKADPHDFQMRPSQARSLAQTDLLVWIGPDLTPWLARALTSLSGSAGSLALLDLHDAPMRRAAETADQSETDPHDHGPLDPHAWLDPQNAAFYLSAIALELSRLDPANATRYQQNATNAAAEIAALASDIGPGLAPLKSVTLIAGHDAFSYLLQRYDLQLTATLSDSAGNAAGVARLRDLQAKIGQADGPVCILLEPGASPDTILNLVSADRIRIVKLDPLGQDIPPGPKHYPQMLRRIADELATCADPAT